MDPGPIFTIDTFSTVTVCFLQTTVTFHTIQLILCFQQTGEIDNLVVRWGKVLSLCCAGLQVACNTFETFPSSYWFDNLGFLLREDLLLCCITPCSWGFPTKRSHVDKAPTSFLALLPGDVFTRGVLLNLFLYFVFVLLGFVFLFLSKTKKK